MKSGTPWECTMTLETVEQVTSNMIARETDALDSMVWWIMVLDETSISFQLAVEKILPLGTNESWGLMGHFAWAAMVDFYSTNLWWQFHDYKNYFWNWICHLLFSILSCNVIGGGTPTTAPPPSPTQCNGVPTTGWSCCSNSNQCNAGGGDCDLDSHCSGSLTCGNNNCRNDFSSSGSNWASSADCCEGIYFITNTFVIFVKGH